MCRVKYHRNSQLSCTVRHVFRTNNVGYVVQPYSRTICSICELDKVLYKHEAGTSSCIITATYCSGVLRLYPWVTNGYIYIYFFFKMSRYFCTQNLGLNITFNTIKQVKVDLSTHDFKVTNKRKPLLLFKHLVSKQSVSA